MNNGSLCCPDIDLPSVFSFWTCEALTVGLAPGGTQKMVDEMLSSTIFDAYWEPSMLFSFLL